MDHGLATADTSLRAVIARALKAYSNLGALGESIADEWQYVNDLVAVHSADMRALADAQPGRILTPATAAAVDLAIAEIAAIIDAHQAIDWLSTFPQIVRLVVAGPLATPAAVATSGALGTPAGGTG